MIAETGTKKSSMSLFERVKTLFMRRSITEEARKAIEEAESLEELRDKLDLAVVELQVIKEERVDREIETLGRDELQHQEKVAKGLVSGREKELSLKKVLQLRKRIASYERQSTILQQKIESNLGILNRIQEMALMEHGNVLQVEEIDDLAVKYGDVKERHERYVEAEQALSGEVEGITENVRLDRELAALEAELKKDFAEREGSEAAAQEAEKAETESAEADFEKAAEAAKKTEDKVLEEEAAALEEEKKDEEKAEKAPIKIRRPSMEEVLATDTATMKPAEEKEPETEREEKRLETE